MDIRYDEHRVMSVLSGACVEARLTTGRSNRSPPTSARRVPLESWPLFSSKPFPHTLSQSAIRLQGQNICFRSMETSPRRPVYHADKRARSLRPSRFYFFVHNVITYRHPAYRCSAIGRRANGHTTRPCVPPVRSTRVRVVLLLLLPIRVYARTCGPTGQRFLSHNTYIHCIAVVSLCVPSPGRTPAVTTPSALTR